MRYFLQILYCFSVVLFFSIASASESNGFNKQIFKRAFIALNRHYLEPARIDSKKMLIKGLYKLQSDVPEIMIQSDNKQITVTVGLAKRMFSTTSIQTLTDLEPLLNQIMDFIQIHYNGTISYDNMTALWINGMLDVLDPHTSFLRKKIYKEFKVGTDGEFGGLGIVISMRDGMLTVVSPIDGTPASQAGIRAGDRIVQIKDESTINMSLTDAVNKIRGKVGTTISIVIERDGAANQTIALTRALINIDSVQSKRFTENQQDIGYIRVKNFQANTVSDVKKALAEFKKNEHALSGLILDLRNNPGGLLDSAIELADLFLSDGTIVSTVGRNDHILDLNMAHYHNTEPPYPMIVLINEGSASASEIVSAALQANNRAIVMGATSFGKGSVQTIFELGNDTAFKITIARYKPAGYIPIQLVGVQPDIKLQPVSVEKKYINLIADKTFSEQDLDEHLDKASIRSNTTEPVQTVHFFKNKEDTDDLDQRSKKEYAKEVDLSGDFAAEFALRILNHSASSEKLITTIRTLAKKEQIEQNKQINAKLHKFDIDWHPTRTSKKPKLKLSMQLIQDDKIVTKAMPGKDLTIRLQAKNIGKGAFSQLIGIGQSEDFSFIQNREFPFGTLLPGQSQSWDNIISLPLSLNTQNILMTVEFNESNHHAPKDTMLRIPIAYKEKPRFGISYNIKSIIPGKTIRPKQSLQAEIDITNHGNYSSSKDTSILIIDECNDKIYLKKGREKIGELAAGNTHHAKLTFYLMDNAPSNACHLDLFITDIKEHVYFRKRLTIKKDIGTILPPNNTNLIAPKITISNPLTETTQHTYTLNAQISDTDAVKDYFIFLNKNKIYYHMASDHNKILPISIPIELKTGINRITIGARDIHQIISQKSLVIEKRN